MVTLKRAYNYYSQIDIPENIFEILFNYSHITFVKNKLNDDQVKAEKNEIHKRLWEIIETNKNEKNSIEKWVPGSVQYPAIIIQLLRARFPSSEPDILLSNCTKYDIKEFIKYTSSSNLPHDFQNTEEQSLII